MIKQYNKVAIGTIDKVMPTDYSPSFTYVIKTNANFKINRAIVFLQDSQNRYGEIGVDSKNYYYHSEILFGNFYNDHREVSVRLQNNNEIVLSVRSMQKEDSRIVKLKSWIAIG